MPKNGDIIKTPDGKTRLWRTSPVPLDRKPTIEWEGAFLVENERIRDGYAIWRYTDTGNCYCEGHFSNNRKIGHWTFYKPDGSIRKESIHIF
jgi:hypothetical protein